MIKTECEKCGSNKLKVLQSNKKTGLYCSKCGALIQWLTRAIDIRDAYNLLINNNDIRGKAIKRVIKYGGTTTIRCEKCGCLLFTSNVEVPCGQFDLIDAKYCPKCGVEFVNDHKEFSKNKYKKY